MITRLTIKVLTKKLRRLTVVEVQWLLRLYVHQHSDFCLIGQTGILYATTPGTLCEDCSWVSPDNPATLVRTRFCGGPSAPGAPRPYYDGSLVTYAIDKILLNHQIMGISYTWLIRFDGDSNRPIWVQLGDRIPEQLEGNSHPPKRDVVFKQKTLFPDYYDDPVSEYARVGDKIIPIHENGSQGWEATGRSSYHLDTLGYGTNLPADDGKVYSWSSSGCTRVNV